MVGFRSSIQDESSMNESVLQSSLRRIPRLPSIYAEPLQTPVSKELPAAILPRLAGLQPQGTDGLGKQATPHPPTPPPRRPHFVTSRKARGRPIQITVTKKKIEKLGQWVSEGES